MSQPDADGTIGSAWKYLGFSDPDIPPEEYRMVGQYLVWCPQISQIRAHWMVFCMNLKPSSAATLPVHNPQSTHAIGIVGIVDSLPMNPHEIYGISLEDTPDVLYEFAASSDNAASNLLDKVAQAICDGKVFPEPGPIAGVGQYHGETLTVMLEESDPSWYLTRMARPSPVLRQMEWPNKTWRITRSTLGTQRIELN